MASDANLELLEESFTDRRGRDAGRGLARRRAFENVAGVVAIVLENSCKISVSWTDAGDGSLPRLRVGRIGRRIHDLLPILPVAILDDHRDRRAEGLAGADAGEELDGVLLDLHASPATVALLASRELGVDVVSNQRQARGHSFKNAHERLAVRFAGGSEAKRHGERIAHARSARVYRARFASSTPDPEPTVRA